MPRLSANLERPNADEVHVHFPPPRLHLQKPGGGEAAMTFRSERGMAALERAAGELRLIITQQCGDKAPGVWALVDQGIRAAREAMTNADAP